jgi:hypothetical protein
MKFLSLWLLERAHEFPHEKLEDAMSMMLFEEIERNKFILLHYEVI